MGLVKRLDQQRSKVQYVIACHEHQIIWYTTYMFVASHELQADLHGEVLAAHRVQIAPNWFMLRGNRFIHCIELSSDLDVPRMQEQWEQTRQRQGLYFSETVFESSFRLEDRAP